MLTPLPGCSHPYFINSTSQISYVHNLITGFLFNSLLTSAHRLSIGLISGLWGGRICCSYFHSRTTFALWLGELSPWRKTLSPWPCIWADMLFLFPFQDNFRSMTGRIVTLEEDIVSMTLHMGGYVVLISIPGQLSLYDRDNCHPGGRHCLHDPAYGLLGQDSHPCCQYSPVRPKCPWTVCIIPGPLADMTPGHHTASSILDCGDNTLLQEALTSSSTDVGDTIIVHQVELDAVVYVS